MARDTCFQNVQRWVEPTMFSAPHRATALPRDQFPDPSHDARHLKKPTCLGESRQTVQTTSESFQEIEGVLREMTELVAAGVGHLRARSAWDIQGVAATKSNPIRSFPSTAFEHLRTTPVLCLHQQVPRLRKLCVRLAILS